MASVEPPSSFLSWLGRSHHALIFERRTRVLAELLAEWIPATAAVLDIGCGDGTIGRLIADHDPGISIQGVEFAPRPGCKIPCVAFDGKTLPFADDSFDVCMFVDVLHHTLELRKLLREAARVSRKFVLIKDHTRESAVDGAILRVMDWVGNRPHGVRLTYSYQSRAEWQAHFAACALQEQKFTARVPLYPPPVSWIAGRGLHFISQLKKIG